MKLDWKRKMILGIVLFTALLITFNPYASNSNWQTASRQSAGLVPPADETPEAQVQIYVAKAFAWRGKFSLHSWIAVKEKNAPQYSVYHAALWNVYMGKGVISSQYDLPDRYWYDARPSIIYSVSGKEAEEMIPKIYAAIESYPYQNLYRAYPGPNSNTFVSYIIRSVPEMKIALPSNAIGKDWLCDNKFFALSESKSGVQFSFYGMFGIILGLQEGIEINLIGLNYGIDFLRPAIKLPGIGRVGMSRS